MHQYANMENKDFAVFGTDDIGPEDIQQGALGNCFFLAALMSIAQKPDRIRNLFTKIDETNKL